MQMKKAREQSPVLDGLLAARERMVEEQIAARGVRDEQVLAAMRRVPRERFVPAQYRDAAYADTPLPIAAGQTISQPYIVAFMIEALNLRGGEKVLEIGAGSGYAAAVLAQIAAQVYAIECVEELAEEAAERLRDTGCGNVSILYSDGTRGWAEFAPFDAILVSAGAPAVPEDLKDQLAVGGRLVVPVGKQQNAQELLRITRRTETGFTTEELADVRFVPLIGEQGWEVDDPAPQSRPARVIRTRPRLGETLPERIARYGEPLETADDADLDALMERIGDARVVLIGEASHGTSEFYSLRARITRQLIEQKGFCIVAAEADWPDAARIDHYVRHRGAAPSEWTAFSRFPTWMWRNTDVRDFVDWLHDHNRSLQPEQRTGFYGLDLYSLYNSTQAVIAYLDDVDPDLAEVARWRYGCLSPWEADPAAYGRAAISDAYRSCEEPVSKMLADLLARRQDYSKQDGERFFDAAQNAALVEHAERYYRTMYYGSRASWNLRDSHMFETLKHLLHAGGDEARAVVWAHNSHVGDARHTEMSARGEHNIGQLCRQEWGDAVRNIGMGTNSGTVAAASSWDGKMEVKRVRPAHPESYEYLFHASERPALLLALRGGNRLDFISALGRPRLERAIGVIYRPETELASHYFEARLPRQFDEYVWFDETKAVTPLDTGEMRGMPDTYPFGV